MGTTPEFGSLRSDDDNWDIVSSVGYTALLVAGWRALHAVSPQPLVRDEYAKVFIAASRDPYLAGVLANPGSTEDEMAFPRLYGVQTRFFDDFFVASGQAGVRQAVIVAAGLDSRAFRLEWPDGTRVILRCNAVTGHQLRSQAEGGGKYISCFTVHTSSPVRLNIVPLASASEPALLGEDRS